MKTLLVMAHFDDEVFSCGEYIYRYPKCTVITACGDDKRRKPFNKVMDHTLCSPLICNFKPLSLSTENIPALANLVEVTLDLENYDRVITHHPDDIHQDHQIVSQAVSVALRRHPNIELLWAKNPEGFPFKMVEWDTFLKKSKNALKLNEYYKGVHIPNTDTEMYKTVRRFSL